MTLPTSTPTNLTVESAVTCDSKLIRGNSRPTLTASTINNNPVASPVVIYFYLYKSDGTYLSYGSATGASGAILKWTMPVTADGDYYFQAKSRADINDGTEALTAFTNPVHFTIDTRTGPAAYINSTTHPTNTPYSDTGAGQFRLTASTNDVAGFFYTWDTTVPSNNQATCNLASYTSGNSGYAKATNGTATIPMPPPVLNTSSTTQPRKLQVKAMGRNGAVSANPETYEYRATPDSHFNTTLEAETLAYTATGATATTTNATPAGGGKVVSVTAVSGGGRVTFPFTTTTTTQTGTWVLQPQLTIPEGSTMTFELDGIPLGTLHTSMGEDGFVTECIPLTIAGTASSQGFPLEGTTCDPNETGTITLTPGPHTLTIITPNPTSYTIDQLRIIRQP